MRPIVGSYTRAFQKSPFRTFSEGFGAWFWSVSVGVFVCVSVGVFVGVFVDVFVGGFVGLVANRRQLYTCLPKIAVYCIFGRVYSMDFH